ncbi:MULTISPECIES: endopeptidase La [unclassified Apibacter]|uniref:endopeptidase La n=1 Tax=unclassified Apibacter TaxID=2630820 RepID=UPI001327D24B|nr:MULTISPECIES: endopeptidase La [unclassified Apibacter]MCX8677312.1 endopeptidase La [Apibacter sp. B3919]MXO25558.1 endopeptidase La [Apibacter sp. B3924]MXO26787.1 endopeptidase La [Apibacter sp. B3813]MXO28643.1 endopeptidase La [Apibacter sp. B3913]MXO30597.1 endopeptidase La [Apibacter sp. B3912]
MKFDILSLDQVMQNDSEFIPLLSQDEEDKMMNETFPTVLPLLPVKNVVLFPGVVIPITAGRNKSINLLQDAQQNDKIIAVITQKDVNADNPTINDMYSVGTIGKILKLLKMPDGSTMVIIQGIRKFSINNILEEEPYLKAEITLLEDKRKVSNKNKEHFNVLLESLRETAIKIINENPAIPSDASFAIKNIEGSSLLVNFVASNLDLPLVKKQELLEVNSLLDRASKTLKYLNVELQKISLKNSIQDKVNSDLSKQQREYFLHQQMKTIQEELGGVSYEAEVQEMKEKASKKKWSKSINEHFEKELNRLVRMNPQTPDYGVQRNYLELMLDLPWEKYSKDNFDINHAEKVLNKDHFGLEDVKERILEYLAVLKLKGDMKSPIICLYGPPGVGKTSLGKSIASALGRKYVRISLGGLHDESEIRGHRKTYIGAMPGRIIQSIKKVGTSNPVIVLDEIDKISTSGHGDPSSALLEVLDPEQNSTFHDNFLDVDYDLSKVLFIATANNLATIQPALLDRMEIIDISGYTIEEKVEIANKYLLPKQILEHGLTKKDISISKKELEFIIQAYTRESGVRGLERKISKIVRNIALQIARNTEYNKKLSQNKIIEILGPPMMPEMSETNKVPGVVTGLAWTQVGGDILFIESILSKGKGNLTMTGNLGNVMKESATIALEYIKSNYKEFGIDPQKIEESNIHIHVPEGATPKDGPSAGIAMLTSLVSSFTGKKVKSKWAMTGEITLRGKVLPVGGIKEKILAAKRAGITDVILCEENRKDIEKINPDYIKGLRIHYVTQMSEVIDLAL